MSIDQNEQELLGILDELRKLPHETEWVEFKHNNAEPDEVGEYLSALANAAALTGKVHAYIGVLLELWKEAKSPAAEAAFPLCKRGLGGFPTGRDHNSFRKPI